MFFAMQLMMQRSYMKLLTTFDSCSNGICVDSSGFDTFPGCVHMLGFGSFQTNPKDGNAATSPWLIGAFVAGGRFAILSSVLLGPSLGAMCWARGMA